MPRSPSHTRDRWRQRMARFHDAGLPVAQFCRQENVSTASFYAWRNKLANQPQPAPAREVPATGSQTPAFREIALAESQPAAADFMSVHLPGGVRLEIPTADERILMLALQTLAACDAAALNGETSC